MENYVSGALWRGWIVKSAQSPSWDTVAGGACRCPECGANAAQCFASGMWPPKTRLGIIKDDF